MTLQSRVAAARQLRRRRSMGALAEADCLADLDSAPATALPYMSWGRTGIGAWAAWCRLPASRAGRSRSGPRYTDISRSGGWWSDPTPLYPRSGRAFDY